MVVVIELKKSAGGWSLDDFDTKWHRHCSITGRELTFCSWGRVAFAKLGIIHKLSFLTDLNAAHAGSIHHQTLTFESIVRHSTEPNHYASG